MEALYTAIRGQLASHAHPNDLLHLAIHAHGSSLTGFINKSYWCPECVRGYNTNDAAKHPCEGTTCYTYTDELLDTLFC